MLSIANMQARGRTIRRKREACGYGLTAFARRVKISASHLSRIERGKANPSPDVLKRIALALQQQTRIADAIAEITDDEQEEKEQ